ncbi:L-allo-threonine aldolase [Thecamonas trahens ATCC 50062]|uniref:L-allo-threonine aldolase n=1 Tax=Thecamonas trahens ATCC 50062 TaxID=461836 RepID=A0A0L0D5K1_THETB|nr:L-allo-threonine aldolase [Thecamonas trahens ATCC 50062]KNC47647.1 L-allo-threonine aldolase [Thecamonas trahens ATCC 50062]|eukprot:XP_013759131.1 L-allo-threonine aldolase [Thecamonas trahens ATCC 50062]
MREAMAAAVVGDDVWGDDPTVVELESMASDVLGKEAALYFPSGTMANLTAVMVHCKERMSEIIMGDECHVHIYENGGYAAVANTPIRIVPTSDDGTLPLDAIEALVRPVNDHFPTSRLLLLENTHNRKGGRVLPKQYMDDACVLASKHNLKVHLDGARLANAAVALGTTIADLAAPVDSVSLCLSKGLGAPVGSVLAGSVEFIATARRVRKMLGGGMRQVGVLAAAGLLALDNVDRLQDDHANAAVLAAGLDKLPGIDVDVVETNIVFFTLDAAAFGATAEAIVDTLRDDYGILIAGGGSRVRLVTHLDVSADDVAKVIDAFGAVHAAAHASV